MTTCRTRLLASLRSKSIVFVVGSGRQRSRAMLLPQFASIACGPENTTFTCERAAACQARSLGATCCWAAAHAAAASSVLNPLTKLTTHLFGLGGVAPNRLGDDALGDSVEVAL